MASESDEAKQRFVLAVDLNVQEALNSSQDGWTASPEFVLALCEALMGYASDCLQPDLLAFANHAKRKMVSAEDVLLVARRSPSLSVKIKQLIEDGTTKKVETAKKRVKSDDDKAKKPKKAKLVAAKPRKDVKEDEEDGRTASDLDGESEGETNYFGDDIFAD